MTIFGTFNFSVLQVNIFPHTADSIDAFFNYFFAILFALSASIGIILNPVVFMFNYRQPQSSATFLFKSLCALDLLMCIFRPFHQVILLTSSKQQPFVIILVVAGASAVGLAGGAAAAATGAAVSAPWFAGFTSAGVAAGSAAAAAQAAVGNVAAGSAFAALQTIGATTILGTVGGPILGAAVFVTGVGGCLL
eukprot:sb/3471024/